MESHHPSQRFVWSRVLTASGILAAIEVPAIRNLQNTVYLQEEMLSQLSSFTASIVAKPTTTPKQ